MSGACENHLSKVLIFSITFIQEIHGTYIICKLKVSKGNFYTNFCVLVNTEVLKQSRKRTRPPSERKAGYNYLAKHNIGEISFKNTSHLDGKNLWCTVNKDLKVLLVSIISGFF